MTLHPTYSMVFGIARHANRSIEWITSICRDRSIDSAQNQFNLTTRILSETQSASTMKGPSESLLVFASLRPSRRSWTDIGNSCCRKATCSSSATGDELPGADSRRNRSDYYVFEHAENSVVRGYRASIFRLRKTEWSAILRAVQVSENLGIRERTRSVVP